MSLKALANANIILEVKTATQQAEDTKGRDKGRRRRRPVSSEGTGHLQLVSNGQGSSQHVAFIQNHPQPVHLQPMTRQ